MLAGIRDKLVHYLDQDSSVIAITIGKDGTILQSNKFASELTGKKLDGCNVNDFFICFDKPFNLSECLLSSHEKKLLNINTSSGLPSTYYFQFYDLEKSILAIGEVNSLEIELLRKNMVELNQELNNLSRELQKKNAELKKLNDLKNQFLGMAAHDLRSPIGIITGYSNFLLEDLKVYLNPEHIKLLNSILSSSEFMLRLLNDLLDISAIESGKLQLNLVKTDIADVIKQNVKLNNFTANKKNINIHFNCSEKIPEIIFDVSKIEQVLNNLISNAVKFSLPGTIVTVSLFLSANDVTVAVADQGQGIPEADLDKLFKPFEKTSIKSTAGEKSTGLGLSIVRKLVIAHKGKIWVESKTGTGSVFYFSIPL